MRRDYLSTCFLNQKYFRVSEVKRGRYELIQVTCAEIIISHTFWLKVMWYSGSLKTHLTLIMYVITGLPHICKMDSYFMVICCFMGRQSLFYPSDRYLWMKLAGEISRSRDLSALSAMFSPAPLPWFVYSNLLQNVSRPFINPTHLTWHGYFMHVVPADIRTSHLS